MKALDEVISQLESYPVSPSTLPMSVMIVQKDDIDDALHYLWEYRTEQKILSDRKEHYEYWEHKYYAELEKNNPLDWDELKTMEGKPVWVEEKQENNKGYSWVDSNWMLIEGFYQDSKFEFEQIILRDSDGDQYAFERDKRTWQAYRKERG